MSYTPWRGVIEEYRDFLPVTADTPIVTLLEGGEDAFKARKRRYAY